MVGDRRWNDTSRQLDMAGRVLVLSGSATVGAQLCLPHPSLYGPRILTSQGSSVASDSDVQLSVANLVPGSSGYFLTSNGNGTLVQPGGSWGNLCIHDPAGMGRHFDSLTTSDAAGLLQFRVDLTAIPIPSGVTSVLPGDTRYWQLWFRDQSGFLTGSNFSSAVAITFQ